jgi:phosphoribosyl 1,2-cyclic phosphodiesterase
MLLPGLPTLRQHVERQRVTIGILISFPHRNRRQHMPDTIIVENVALTGFTHDEAIYLMFVIVGDDDFSATHTAAGQQMRDNIFLAIFMQARRARIAWPPRRSRKPDHVQVDKILCTHSGEWQISKMVSNQFANPDAAGDRPWQWSILSPLPAQCRVVFFQLHIRSAVIAGPYLDTTFNNFSVKTVERAIPVSAVIIFVSRNRPRSMGQLLQRARNVEINSEWLTAKPLLNEVVSRSGIDLNWNEAILIHESSRSTIQDRSRSISHHDLASPALDSAGKRRESEGPKLRWEPSGQLTESACHRKILGTQSSRAPLFTTMRIKFWGVRGSTPTPQPENMRYGGNTSCVEVRLGDQIYIFDCGTGFRVLGQELQSEFGEKPFTAHVFVSHFHWDHIQGMPFFRPLYANPENRFLFQCSARTRSLKQVLADQMAAPYFPVRLDQMQARRDFYDIDNGCIDLEAGAKMKTAWLNHPQGCMGFRMETKDGILVYATDNEPGDAKFDKAVRKLAEGADVLIYDAQYLPEEYEARRRGWGHSHWREAVNVVMESGAKELVLFHHDPEHTDVVIDKVVHEARNYYPKVRAASEGMEIILTQSPNRK